MLTSIDKKTLTYTLYNGNQNYERFVHLKEIIQQNPVLRNSLEFYSLPYKQRIEFEFKAIKEIIRLYKEKILTFDHIRYLPYFLQYSHPFEVHFGLFKNIVETFGSEKQTEDLLSQINNLQILGSVLLSELNLFNNQRVHNIQDVTTKAIFDPERKVFTLTSEDNNVKVCDYFSYYSTHAIVFAKLFIGGGCFGVYPFLIEMRNGGNSNSKIAVEWLGKVVGERTHRQYLVRFKALEIPLSSLVFDDDINKISAGAKKSLNNFRVVKLLQSFEEGRKSVIDLAKCVFLVAKYNYFRTQFTTLEGSKDERKILQYQNNSNKVLKAFTETIIFSIGLNYLENNQKMVLSNIARNAQRIEYLNYFVNAIRSHLFKENLASIQNLRENCGGYGFLQYSGIPAIQENALLNVTVENNLKDYLADLALISLGKLGTAENCAKFNGYYFPLLFKSDKLDSAYADIESLPNKSVDNFVYLARLFNLKCAILRARLAKKFANLDELNTKLLIANDPLVYENVIELGQSLVDYFCVSKAIDFIVFVIYRPVNKLIMMILNSFLINRLTENYDVLTEVLKGKPLIEALNAFTEQRMKDYEALLGNYLMDGIESFEFDENSLNCVLEGGRDQFYGKLFDTMLNKNRRNDPKTVEEMVNPMRTFLNRSNL